MMNFAQVEKEVARLRQDLAAGRLTEEECKAQMHEMMVEDADGNWWMVGYETGEWYRHDDTDWVRADPPGRAAQQAAPKPVTQPVEIAEPKPRPFRGIVVFVLTEIVMIVVGWAFALAIAFLFFDQRDNLVSWIVWIGKVSGDLSPAIVQLEKPGGESEAATKPATPKTRPTPVATAPRLIPCRAARPAL